jgi:hypothetical protein
MWGNSLESLGGLGVFSVVRIYNAEISLARLENETILLDFEQTL